MWERLRFALAAGLLFLAVLLVADPVAAQDGQRRPRRLPDGRDSPRATLFGFLEAMDDIQTVGNHPILFGDFRRGYLIVDRVGLRITVDDNITTPGYVNWYIRKRVGGILLDVVLGDHFYLSPSAGVGYYHEGGGRDLGSVLEFRTQFEAGYRFENRSRLGLAFSHISNASIGSSNPGTEILTLYYHMPFDWIF